MTVFVLIASRLAEAATELPRVPDGFSIEKVADASLVRYPMMAGFDDRGRLFVTASAGRNLTAAELMKDPVNFIQMLEDTDGDGRFDKSTRFADKMTLPMGALWYRGALYVASPPAIWRLEDTDGDGVADKRQAIVNNFGFSGNAASVHGPFLGPCGRIYWCDGRHGHEFTDAGGNVTSSGLAARIFSCRPDGTDVQTYCGGGMDNPVEIDFMPTGEMIGSVNILRSQPRVDCLMHWLVGGVYPHYEQAYAEFPRTGQLLEPMTRLGHVAVSGMTRYRGSQFGSDYRNALFTTLFNTRKVVCSRSARVGATFTTREEDFLVSGTPHFHPTDVLEDADGSLLVIDTGGWFLIGCPASQIAKPEIEGAIYRIRRQDAKPAKDPWGAQESVSLRHPDTSIRLLDDARSAVRELAINRLSQIGSASIGPLRRVVENADGSYMPRARRNATWSLSRIDDGAARAALRSALQDEDESVRIAAARSLGVVGDVAAVELLAGLVLHDTPPVRRQAADALGQILEPPTKIAATVAQATSENIEARDRNDRFRPVTARPGASAGSVSIAPPVRSAAIATSLESLFTSLPDASSDRALEHAIIFAILRIADREQTIPYLRHTNPQVRRAALIALDQMEGGNLTRELVTPLLDTEDPALQQQALEVIGAHSGWASETLDLLRNWITASDIAPERVPVLRGFLIAQAGDSDVQQLVAQSLASPQLNLKLRLLLLEVIDRCTLEALPDSWHTRLRDALERSGEKVRLQALRTIAARNLTSFDDQIHRLAHEVTQTEEIRVEAFSCIAGRLKSIDVASYEFVRSETISAESPFLRIAAAGALASSPLSDQQLVDLATHLAAMGPLAIPVVVRAYAEAKSERVGRALVTALGEPQVASSLSSDAIVQLIRPFPAGVQEAASDILERLAAELEAKAARLAELESRAGGGDAARGREVFFSKRATCSSCHTVAGEGGRVGPDLTTIGDIRSRRDLLEAIVFPSASFARGFRTYAVATDAGRVHTGIVSRQTADAIYLRNAQLAEVRIPRDHVEEMAESDTSIMPTGFDKVLGPSDLRDLIAFLLAQKTTRGPAGKTLSIAKP
ncbi:MAG: PVC-type heme-binding CxxCH protein [Pirellulales bacterium]